MPWYQPFYLLTFLSGSIGPELNIGVQGIMGISYLFTCQPVNLSTCLPGLTGPEANIIPCSPIFTSDPVKYGIPIMPCSPINTSEPVNPGRQVEVDRSTGEQVRVTRNALISTFLPINLSTRVDRSRVKNRSSGNYGFSYLFTCQPVNLSTCLPGLTGPEANLIPCSPIFTSDPVKYGIPIMPCSPINTSDPVNPGRQVDMLTGRQMNTYGLPIISCSPKFASEPVNLHSNFCPGPVNPGGR